MFLIVHNPLSSNKKSKKTTIKYVNFFKKNNIPFRLRSTLKIDNLNAFLEKNNQITDILYLGGDGSINYLINSVELSKIKQNIYLGKSGSGNDFLRTLKKYKTAEITIGEAKTNNGTTRFINGCGLGFDGLVCHYVNNDKKKGKLTYFLNVFKSIIKYKPVEIEVIVDDKPYQFKKVFISAVQNGVFFGGGMKATPKADPTDNQYEICIAHNLSKLTLQLLLLSIYPGWHTKIKRKVTMLKGQNIRINHPSDTYFQADGEVLSNVSTIDIKPVEKRVFIAFNKKDFKNKSAK
ncbi:MAG: diacylglycerol kinase family protein [Candidatus Izemoplasmatales bacterium]|nr:diacylglycerol kinase family protein [Candidatus Izemoplasmatales bacterium]MDY0139366.1 diacylglycerol kinase family protein [Candidatus Izemoplasmatales bacterium]